VSGVSELKASRHGASWDLTLHPEVLSRLLQLCRQSPWLCLLVRWVGAWASHWASPAVYPTPFCRLRGRLIRLLFYSCFQKLAGHARYKQGDSNVQSRFCLRGVQALPLARSDPPWSVVQADIPAAPGWSSSRTNHSCCHCPHPYESRVKLTCLTTV